MRTLNTQAEGRQEVAPSRLSPTVEESRPPATGSSQLPNGSGVSSENLPGPGQISSNQIFPQQEGTSAPASASDIQVQPEDDGFLASIFSGTSVLIVTALGLFGLLVTRKLRSEQPVVVHTSQTLSSEESDLNHDRFGGINQSRDSRRSDGNTSLAKPGDSALVNGSPRQTMVRSPSAGPASLYGAYRIDQEVGKLILGQPHRIDGLLHVPAMIGGR